jgi:cupin 2 domain-containing protein
MESGNVFADVPARLEHEQFLDLLLAPGIRITRIVSTGHFTDWQEPEEDEWVLVLQGSGTLRFADDGVIEMKSGDWRHIPAGTRHRVEETDPGQPTIWLAVHFPPSDLNFDK